MKSISKILLVLAVLLVGVASVSARKAPGSKVGTEFSTLVFDFGTVNADKGSVEHKFIMTNTGTQPVAILTAVPSCGCTVADYSKKPIEPGEATTIKVKFNLAGQRGEINKDVKLRLKSASATERVTLKIKGVVIP